MKKADENLDSEFNEERKTEYNNNKYEIENLGNEINMNFSKLDEDQEKKLPQEILNHKRLLQMGKFWTLKGMIGDERTLMDTESELAEVNEIIRRDGKDKNFDRVGYTNEKAKLEKQIRNLKRKMNKN